MGAANAHTNYLNSIMRDSLVTDEIIDNFFVGNPTLDWFWSRREVQDGGINCNWTFYTSDPQHGQTISPYEDYYVAPVDDELQASIIWADYVFPFTLSKVLMKKIRGKDALIDYLQQAMRKTQKSARRQLSSDLYGSGADYVHPVFAGKTNTNPLFGLAGIIAVDRTYAGFDSTTYTQLDSYVDSVTSAAYSDLYTSAHADFLPDHMEEVMSETDFDDGEEIDFITTTKLGLGALKRTAYRGSTASAASSLGGLRLDHDGYEAYKARAGVKHFEWEGVDVVRDTNCTAGAMYFMNSDTMFMKVLKGRNMDFEDIEPNATGDPLVGSFHVSAQIICTEPRRQGKITGISTTR